MDTIAILDVGKTNKKLILFDEQYRIVQEKTVCFGETVDEDGDPCEDLLQLSGWVFKTLEELEKQKEFLVKALNFSAYGASFVHVGADRVPVAPLYNYLKPYPSQLQKAFYEKYNGEVTFSMQTASPVLGSLNSGLQLYRLKEEQPELFARISYSLHLPQYLSFLVTGRFVTDLTSIGCHTGLWNFAQQHYHEWVYREGIADKLAPLGKATDVVAVRGIREDAFPKAAAGIAGKAVAGTGLHDSSSAIIPYLASFHEPFILISTGTWCISMNPFNDMPLTAGELQQDCLCYLTYEGRPVKASRLFAGYEHERQVLRLAAHFQKASDYHRLVRFDPALAEERPKAAMAGDKTSGEGLVLKAGAILKEDAVLMGQRGMPGTDAFVFARRDLSRFRDYEAAYHRLMMDLMEAQIESTRLVLQGTAVKRIFVDGGFGRNQVYMHLLASAFPELEVFAASMPQATAMGAALAIHDHWNSQVRPGDIIELKYFRGDGVAG